MPATYLTQVDETTYATFLASLDAHISGEPRDADRPATGAPWLTAALGLTHRPQDPEPERFGCEGDSRVSNGAQDAALVLPDQRFAAVQWLEAAPGLPASTVENAASSTLFVCECFFVVTATKGALCGLVVRSLLGSRTGDHATALAPAAQSLAQRWWLTQPWRGLAIEDWAVPSFLQLVTQAASATPLTTANPLVLDSLHATRHELAYFKTLCEDQQEELSELRAQLEDARSQWSLMSLGPNEATAQAPAAAPPADIALASPYAGVSDLSGLPAWVEAHEEAIIVMPRALSGAKKSIFQTPALVYVGLEFLSGPYREYRRGRLSKRSMETALEQTGLKLAGSISPSVAGEQGNDYFVSWGGRRRFLDLHLLKGGGRDERYCLRIYFCWSADDEKAIVGALPFHLANSLS